MKDEFIYDREFFEEFGIDPNEIIEILESYKLIRDIIEGNKPARIRALMVLKQNQANLLSSV